MKIEHLTSHLNFNSSPHMHSAKGKAKKGAVYLGERTSVENKSVNKNRPAKSVNFSGSVSLNDVIEAKPAQIIQEELTKLVTEGKTKDFKNINLNAGKLSYGFINSKFMTRALTIVNENESKFENIITIFLAGMLKPLCVLAMPGAEKEDKQMSATKNFVSAVIGFGLSCLILTPVSKSVKKVTKNLNKFIKDPDYIRLIDKKEFGDFVKYGGKEVEVGSMADAFSTFYKKIPDLAITPTKAAISIALTPYVLDFIFKKDKKEAAKAQTAQPNIQTQPSGIELKENEQIFNQFRGGAIR